MKEYLKMADVFSLPVNQETLEVYCKEAMKKFEGTEEYAAHAINSHDELVENVLHYEADALMWERRAVTEASRAQELVAEVERLKKAIELASMTLDEVDRVLTERIKNGAYDLDDISAEVEGAIKRLSETE